MSFSDQYCLFTVLLAEIELNLQTCHCCWKQLNESCKLFFAFVIQHVSYLFLFFLFYLSGMFIVSWLELQKQQLKEGVNHSFQSGWVQSLTKWFWVKWSYAITIWFTHTSWAPHSARSHDSYVSYEIHYRKVRQRWWNTNERYLPVTISSSLKIYTC